LVVAFLLFRFIAVGVGRRFSAVPVCSSGCSAQQLDCSGLQQWVFRVAFRLFRFAAVGVPRRHAQARRSTSRRPPPPARPPPEQLELPEFIEAEIDEPIDEPAFDF
jgi:hypothetical protein